MKKVLIVDDKEENLYYLQVLLGGHDYEVYSARHGAEALVKARISPPDLVISDLLMPVMDGYTLLRHWKADVRLKQVPFIVYTATYTEPEDERLALSLGADAFLLKPCEPEEFLARLKELEARLVSAVPATPTHPVGEEKELLEIYSETLIRKLEEKTLQLEVSNVALLKDVVERKRVEESLRLLNSAVLQSKESILITDAELDFPGPKIIFVNPAFTEMTGYTAEEAIGQTPRLLQGPRTDLNVLKRLRKNLEQGEVFKGETFNYRKDGTEYFQEWHIAPILDHSGKITHYVANQRDITQRKHTEQRIVEQAALLDKAQDAILVRDLEHRVTYWNKSAERLYGWTFEEAMGRSVREFLNPDKEAFDEAMRQVLEKGDCDGEFSVEGKDGRQITVESRWTLVRNESGQAEAVLVINTDITERKKLEQQFLRAQRMESIGTLAGGIAHDLNNVLGPIIMSLDLMKMKFTDSSSQELLDIISSSAHRGADMVRQVLSFARGLEGRRIEVQIKHLLQDIEKIISDTFLKHIQIETIIAKDLWAVVGDPTQLHQVLLNLCVNARDAMSDRGVLTLSAENVTFDEHYAGLNLDARVGPYVSIHIEDNGTGMPPEVIEKIFDPFYTTKELGKGTGLGLSTSLGIVKSHGGFIRVYSEPGKGTVFRVYLPAKMEISQETAASVEAQIPRGQGELILVVDDEASVRQITRQTLEAFGYRVLLASDGSEAVALYASHRNEISAMLTDMMMPGLDGPATIHVLQKMNPHLPIIAASGLSTESQVARATSLGVKYFLPKPYTAERMLTILQKIFTIPGE